MLPNRYKAIQPVEEPSVLLSLACRAGNHAFAGCA